MKGISIRRGWIVTTVLVVVLAAALPGAVRRIIETGDPYIATDQFFHDMLVRLSGPGRIRFILQPVMAILLGIVGGRLDAKLGRPSFLHALMFHRGERWKLFRHGVASIRDLVAVAIILDIVAQALIFGQLHPGASLILGPVLIATPYALARELTSRLSQRHVAHASSARPG